MDYLRGLKEDVMMGRLIPAGTGFEVCRAIRIAPDEPPPYPEELELQREVDDLTDADDMFGDDGK